MSDIAIEVNGVWKKFHLGETHDSLRDFIPAVARRVVGRGPKRSELSAGDFWSLKDVSFSLRRGDAPGIIGLNGAGKSTLLKILSRVLRPNRGRYRVRGRLRALIEIAAGFHMDLTGRENIYLNGSILGMRKREIDAKLDQIVDFSGVEEFLDTPVKRYSSGMLARLGFAVAAHMDPEVLLIDEVLSVGDATFRNKCVEHMRSLVRSGVAVVFISHNLDQVVDLCREAIVLSQGQAVYAGHAGAAVSHYLDLCADAGDELGQRSGPGSRVHASRRGRGIVFSFPGRFARDSASDSSRGGDPSAGERVHGGGVSPRFAERSDRGELPVAFRSRWTGSADSRRLPGPDAL